MDRLLSLAEDRAKVIDSIISEITSGLKVDCGKGCVYCCYGVPLWVKTIEAFHILHALNRLPIRERKSVASEIRRYRREYKRAADMQGYTLESPVPEIALDTEKLGLICGLGMNDIPCPFLSGDGGCRIYEARPSMCRLTLFYDREICRRDWENPLAFVWKNDIAPFIENVKEEFHRRWNVELDKLRREYPEVDLSRLEGEVLFLPEHLRFDPFRKTFKLSVAYNP